MRKHGGIKEILETRQFPGIITTDTFGINKVFVDKKTGIKVDSWKDWEKAGFRDPLDTHKDPNVKAGIKRKIKKITKYDNHKRMNFS